MRWCGIGEEIEYTETVVRELECIASSNSKTCYTIESKRDSISIHKTFYQHDQNSVATTTLKITITSDNMLNISRYENSQLVTQLSIDINNVLFDDYIIELFNAYYVDEVKIFLENLQRLIIYLIRSKVFKDF